jgi:SprT protein
MAMRTGTVRIAMLASAPMPIPSTVPTHIRKRLDRWLTQWGVPSLSKTLRVEFSPRLRRAFGRCYQDERLIRLTPSLLDSQSWLLAEILCHEAAHAAVYEIYGGDAKPHGEEWEELMRMVGFEPRVRIPVVVNGRETVAEDRVLYLHHCPSCNHSRRAAKPMHRWRCRTCVDDGGHGRFVIMKHEHGAGRARRRVEHPHEDRRRAVASNGPAKRTAKKRAARA